jgi:hypothetical protein
MFIVVLALTCELRVRPFDGCHHDRKWKRLDIRERDFFVCSATYLQLACFV